MEETNTEDGTEMLAMRRSRRSTAGNRMAEVMAEVALENEQKDLDDDIDFENANDEQDVFESDFESTDEEAEKQAEETGEVEAVQEEKRVKQAARNRLEKATAAAHEKNKATFNADVQISATPTKLRPRVKTNRVQLGTVVDAATGEVVVSKSREKASKTRTSKRKHTVLNTSATVTRLKESEQKKASQPKKTKAETKTYTQAELIAMALDTEEGNIREHRDYLKNEEEKRKRARVVRTAVEGPKLRWVSRIEEVKVPIPASGPTPPAIAAPPISIASSAYRSVYGPAGTLFTPANYTFSSGSLVKSNLPSTPTPQPTTSSQYQYAPYQHTAFPVWPPPQQQPYFAPSTSTTPATSFPTPSTTLSQEPSSSTPATGSTDPLPLNNATTQASKPQAATPIEPPQPEFRLEKVTKDYLIHELTQQKGGPKPSWNENMKAMFGDHVKWDEVKVFVGKNRPLSRPRQTCPITGRQAHYLDPRTGVPYADSHAFKVLSQLLEHEYVWNPSAGSYMDHGKPPPEAEAGEGDQGQDIGGSGDIIMDAL